LPSGFGDSFASDVASGSAAADEAEGVLEAEGVPVEAELFELQAVMTSDNVMITALAVNAILLVFMSCPPKE